MKKYELSVNYTNLNWLERKETSARSTRMA